MFPCSPTTLPKIAGVVLAWWGFYLRRRIKAWVGGHVLVSCRQKLSAGLVFPSACANDLVVTRRGKGGARCRALERRRRDERKVELRGPKRESWIRRRFVTVPGPLGSKTFTCPVVVYDAMPVPALGRRHKRQTPVAVRVLRFSVDERNSRTWWNKTTFFFQFCPSRKEVEVC